MCWDIMHAELWVRASSVSPNKPPFRDGWGANRSFLISLPTPIKVNELDQILDGYNTEKRRFLVDGFSQGFTLGYSGPRE